MAKVPVVVVTCDGGGKHASKPATVAAFIRTRAGWAEIRPANVREAWEKGTQSGIPVLDALRHVSEAASDQILTDHDVPWGPNLSLMLQDPHDKMLRDRYRLDCSLCKKRGTPNTLTISKGLDTLLDALVNTGRHAVTIDLLRKAQGRVL